MEALTAVSVAALTVYDMVKAVDKAMVIGEIRLVEKRAGVRAVAAGTMKVVSSVYSDPVWTLPPAHVASLRARFPHVAVVTPRRARLASRVSDADVLFLSQLRPDEFAAAPGCVGSRAPRPVSAACCSPSCATARWC